MKSKRILLYSTAGVLLVVVSGAIFFSDSTTSEVSEPPLPQTNFEQNRPRENSQRASLEIHQEDFLDSQPSTSLQMQVEVQVGEVVSEARRRLRDLEGEIGSGYVDPEKRQIFIEHLQSAKSSEERHQLIGAYRQSVMKQRDETEDQLTDAQKTDRTRYQAISRLAQIQHALPQMDWSGEFREETEAFGDALLKFSSTAFDADQETLTQECSTIQENFVKLMSRSMELQRSLAAQKN